MPTSRPRRANSRARFPPERARRATRIRTDDGCQRSDARRAVIWHLSIRYLTSAICQLVMDRICAIGLMSGTSYDGVDVALINTDGEEIGRLGPTLYRPYAG